MSLLGIMEIMWKVDGEVSWFEYSFIGYLINIYSGQDILQVAAVIQLVVDIVQDRHPVAENVIIQLDNASGSASQELILFIFNINTILDDEKMLRWADEYSHNYRQEKHDWVLTNNFSIIQSKHIWRMKMICSLRMIFWRI